MANWFLQPFLAPGMIPTDVFPAPVLHGISLPNPQVWASDHSVHLFQIHNEDKDSSLYLKRMLRTWAARAWEEDWKSTKSPQSREWQIQKKEKEKEKKTYKTALLQRLEDTAQMPYALKLHTFFFHICSRALQCWQLRVKHESISSLTKAIIIRQDPESWGHRKESANKPGWPTKEEEPHNWDKEALRKPMN